MGARIGASRGYRKVFGSRLPYRVLVSNYTCLYDTIETSAVILSVKLYNGSATRRGYWSYLRRTLKTRQLPYVNNTLLPKVLSKHCVHVTGIIAKKENLCYPFFFRIPGHSAFRTRPERIPTRTDTIPIRDCNSATKMA